MLIHAWGVAQNLFMPEMFAGFSGQAEMAAAMKKWSIPMALTSATSAVMSAILIWGAVQLLRKHASARRLLLIWAIVRSLQGLGAAVVVGLMQEEQVRASMVTASAQGGPPAALGFVIGSATQVFAIATYALWAMVLPAFVIVWMVLPRVRRDMAGWKAAARGGSQS